MALRITAVRAATSEEWDSTWLGCDYSTYFHSREWAEIWAAYSLGRMRPRPLVVTLSDGKRALLPLSASAHLGGVLRQHVSSPAGTFGGWITTDDLVVDHAVLLGRYLSEKLGALVWRLNPYDPLLAVSGIEPSRTDDTQVLDLTSGFDAISRKWTKGPVLRAVRRACREGVRVEIASTRDDWRAYYETYEASLQRWSRPSSAYGWELFDTIHSRRSPYIRLWCARAEGRVVAGALCFYSMKHVVYWHGAALKEYFPLRPANLLIHEIVKDACERGHVWFDFNPSGGHEGVKAFKKSFGPEVRASAVVIRHSRLQRAYAALIRRATFAKRARA